MECPTSFSVLTGHKHILSYEPHSQGHGDRIVPRNTLGTEFLNTLGTEVFVSNRPESSINKKAESSETLG